MMGGFDDHLREFNNYNTVFGSFWFNILCVSCNLIEILTSVVLLGYYHSVITLDYIWWPFIEMIRLFTLTILRFDVMLKGVDNYDENRNGFKYTKRMIILCNLIGFFVILIGAPIYLSLLSTPTNSQYGDRSTIYTIFMSIYPSFIIIRICLTLPMYCVLLIGTNPIYSINNGYQRIDDAVASRHRRRTTRRRRSSSQGDGYEENEERDSQEERAHRQMRRQWRLMELEQRQMQLAMEESRRDSFRKTVKAQDQEYERALKEAKENDNDEKGIDLEQCDSKQMHTEEITPFSSNPISSAPITSNDDYEFNAYEYEAQSDDIMDQSYDINQHIVLDPLPNEAEDNNECVYIRVRLPNGVRSERRFHYTQNVGDMILWTQHECLKHNQSHLIGHSQLVSTMPHTVYCDKEKNLKMLNFWRPNSKRTLVSPLLYVEEL